MNASILMIDTICGSPTSGLPTPHKAGVDGSGKRFILVSDEKSVEETPSESISSYNISINNNTNSIEKAPLESDLASPEKTKTEIPSETQEGSGSNKPAPILELNEEPGLEIALWVENCTLAEKSSTLEDNAQIDPQSTQTGPGHQVQNISAPDKEVKNADIIGLTFNSEDQTPPEGIAIDLPESTPSTIHQSEGQENPDTTPVLKPAGTTTPTKISDKVDTPVETISKPFQNWIPGPPLPPRIQEGKLHVLQGETPSVTSHANVTPENITQLEDDSAISETPGKPVVNPKDFILDGVVNDDSKATINDTNASTIPIPKEVQDAINSMPNQVKSPETQVSVQKADADKSQSGLSEAVNMTTAESQNPKGKASIHTENGFSNTIAKEFNTNELKASATGTEPHPEDTSESTREGSSTDINKPQTKADQVFVQNESSNRFMIYTPMDRHPDSVAAEITPQLVNPGSHIDNHSSTPFNDASADVGKQILESIQSSQIDRGGDRQITIRLNPPELGKVVIKFQEQNSDLTGFLEVNKTQTRIEVEHALPQIIRHLADCGIQIRRLDVMLSEHDRPGYGTAGDSSSQNNGSFEQNSTGSQTPDSDASPNGIGEWPPTNKMFQSISELQEMLVGEDSVNVLI